MRRDRIVVLFAAMAFAVAPAAASAAEAPLLSGYGGPGAGEQQVIGSTLVGGGRGGSDAPASKPESSVSPGSVATPGDSSAGVGASAEATAPPAHEPGSSGSKRTSHGAKHVHAAAGPAGGKGSGNGGSRGQGTAGNSAAGKGSAASGTAPAVSRALELAADRSSTLGLTGGQLLAIVLAAVGLLLISLLTWRLSRV